MDASKTLSPRRRATRGIRLGIGAGTALVKLAAAGMLTALLVIAVLHRWNIFELIAIGAIWAIVFAGMIVVPVLASFIARSLGQYGAKRPFTPPDHGYGTAPRAQVSSPPTYPPALRPEARSWSSRLQGSGPLATNLGVASGSDWAGLVERMATRLETTLGEGYSASADGTALVLGHGDSVRSVDLGPVFAPPPPEVGELALRGCLRMMEEAQMFSMRFRQAPWPSRDGTPNGAPGNLARARVRMDEGEIRMVWADSRGVVLRLRPLPFDVGRGRAGP